MGSAHCLSAQLSSCQCLSSLLHHYSIDNVRPKSHQAQVCCYACLLFLWGRDYLLGPTTKWMGLATCSVFMKKVLDYLFGLYEKGVAWAWLPVRSL